MNSNNTKKEKNIKTLPSFISTPLAEVYGTLIGDGCISTYYSKSRNKQLYVVMFTGHTHDFEYYEKTIRPIIIKEFGVKGTICHRGKQRGQCMDYSIWGKRVFCWFKDQGFPVGKKIKLMMPDEIMQDNDLSLACVRGIFNTDGSIYNRYSKKYKSHAKLYNYRNIEFKMNSGELISQIKEILEKNGIKTSNIRKNLKSYVLNIHDQKFVKLFFEIVKPSNQYHKERFLNLR